MVNATRNREDGGGGAKPPVHTTFLNVKSYSWGAKIKVQFFVLIIV